MGLLRIKDGNNNLINIPKRGVILVCHVSSSLRSYEFLSIS